MLISSQKLRLGQNIAFIPNAYGKRRPHNLKEMVTDGDVNLWALDEHTQVGLQYY
jgi:hypothetical protein